MEIFLRALIFEGAQTSFYLLYLNLLELSATTRLKVQTKPKHALSIKAPETEFYIYQFKYYGEFLVAFFFIL